MLCSLFTVLGVKQGLALRAIVAVFAIQGCLATVDSPTDAGNLGTEAANVGAQTGNLGTDTGNLEAETGNLGAETGNMRAETGNLGAETGNLAAETGNLGAETGNLGAETGSLGTETGNMGAETGNLGAETGSLGAETGNLGAETGNLEAETGNLGAETGNMGPETGNLGAETGNLGPETGNLGAETGNLGTETGNLGAETGNLGAETGNLGAETGSLGTETGNMGAETGSLGAETGNLGAETGNLGAESGNLGAETGSLGAETGNLGPETGSLGAETGNLGAETGNLRAETGNLGTETGNLGAETGNLGAETGSLGAETGNLGAETGSLGTESGNLGTEIGNLGTEGGTIGETQVAENSVQHRDSSSLDQQGQMIDNPVHEYIGDRPRSPDTENVDHDRSPLGDEEQGGTQGSGTLSDQIPEPYNNIHNAGSVPHYIDQGRPITGEVDRGPEGPHAHPHLNGEHPHIDLPLIPHVHGVTNAPQVPQIPLTPLTTSTASSSRNSTESGTENETSSVPSTHGHEIPPAHVPHPRIDHSETSPQPVSQETEPPTPPGEMISPTRVVTTDRLSTGPEVLIPNPDHNLRLISRVVIEETETFQETELLTSSLIQIESSETLILPSRRVLVNTEQETPSIPPETDTVFIDASSESVLPGASSYIHEGTSTSKLPTEEKTPKVGGEEVTEVASSVFMMSVSVTQIAPSVAITSLPTTDTTSEATEGIVPTDIPSTSGTSSEPDVHTLPSGSHEIVIQKNSSLSFVSITTPAPSVNRSSQTTSGLTSTPSSTSTRLTTPTTSSTTTTATTTTHTSTPGTGINTTKRKRKLRPQHTTLSSNETVNGTVTEPTTNGTDHRKKTDRPTSRGTTLSSLEPPVTQSTAASQNSSTSPSSSSTRTTSRTPTRSSAGFRTTKSGVASTTSHRAHTPTPPPVFVQVELRMSWRDFCDKKVSFRADLKEIIYEKGGRNVSVEQIILLRIQIDKCVNFIDFDMNSNINVYFYLVDRTGHFDEELTRECATFVFQGFTESVQSYFKDKLLKVKLSTDTNSEETTERVDETEGTSRPSMFAMEPGITIAVVIATVGGVCCIALIILQILMRRHNKQIYLENNNARHQSFTSTDSIALASVTKSRPNSGLFNPGLEPQEMMEPSYPMNFSGISNRCLEPEIIKEEFQLVPNYTPKLSTVPVGAEDKNRYANVIPIPHTRVKLKKTSQEVSDYINANFVTGYGDDKRAYIATQAPLDWTIADFWRMVWEQQSRVIIMLTAIKENGHPKCAHYWPDCLGDSLQRYGDFMISMKKKDVHPEYIISILELKDIENNLIREVKHCMYTSWPLNGIPEPLSLVKFILDTRVFYEDSGAPLIVHCSPGTGRTGTFISLDLCMRQYENRRIVDVLNTIFRLRQERAGSVQTKEQYLLIYNAVNEYAAVLSSPAISTASSSVTLHAIP